MIFLRQRARPPFTVPVAEHVNLERGADDLVRIMQAPVKEDETQNSLSVVLPMLR